MAYRTGMRVTTNSTPPRGISRAVPSDVPAGAGAAAAQAGRPLIMWEPTHRAALDSTPAAFFTP